MWLWGKIKQFWSWLIGTAQAQSMCELLIKVDPACLSSNQEEGHVVAVLEDGHVYSELEKRLFVIAQVSMTVEEAKEFYLKDGVPDEVKQAAKDAEKAHFDALKNTKLKESDAKAYQAAIDEARALVDKTRYSFSDYPSRANYVDMTKVPTEAVQVVLDTRGALTTNLEAIKNSAKSAVLAVYEDIVGRPLTEVELSKSTKEIRASLEATKEEVAAGDPIVSKKDLDIDSLFSAGKLGQDLERDQILESIEAHSKVQL